MFGSSIARALLRPLCVPIFLLYLAACGPAEEPSSVTSNAPASYAGSAACTACHETQFSSWQDSHHALAMQHATPETVLGDFSNAEFRHYDTPSTFYQRNGTFFVRTDGPTGELQEYPVKFTFGVVPLQQYLIEFPGGRLQTLPIAWDSRPPEDGGQRWFHIYADERIDYTDQLHWTRREQNWNYMCAECHSTNLEKNYNSDSDAFATTWSEISVGCEACHGPGSGHVEQANKGDFGSRYGLLMDLDDNGRAVWQMNPDTGIAARSEPRMRPPIQPEACGRCHARRSVAASEYVFDRPLMDTHAPSLLDDGLYFDDGQIRDEVYVYGSFVQSRMYQAGVSCSNCHEPHSARLRTGSEPSDICSTCHLPAHFDAIEHHNHHPESVACVDCHMTSRNFMVIDGRRDHSFRIPRPDLSDTIGSPNACNQCHSDRDAAWASAAIVSWYGEDRPPHFGTALHAGRAGGGNQPLIAAAGNSDFPGIARGTALAALQPPYSQQVAQTIQSALQSADSFVRLGALRALPGLQPDLQVDWAAPLLSDRVRNIRIEAARVISPIRDNLHVRFEAQFGVAEQELKDSIQAIAERPEAQANLANLYIEAGNAELGEAALRVALRLEPGAVGPRVNLADLYRRLGRDEDAEILLREGLETSPDEASYRHALGLLLVRNDNAAEGLEELRAAAELQADNPRFVYVYAVALNSLGRSADAIDYLVGMRDKFPGNFDINWVLATMLRDQGRIDESREVAEALASIYPDIPPLSNLLQILAL
jgi:tetratricopeptide (TPR) repeat protein